MIVAYIAQRCIAEEGSVLRYMPVDPMVDAQRLLGGSAYGVQLIGSPDIESLTEFVQPWRSLQVMRLDAGRPHPEGLDFVLPAGALSLYLRLIEVFGEPA